MVTLLEIETQIKDSLSDQDVLRTFAAELIENAFENDEGEQVVLFEENRLAIFRQFLQIFETEGVFVDEINNNYFWLYLRTNVMKQILDTILEIINNDESGSFSTPDAEELLRFVSIEFIDQTINELEIPYQILCFAVEQLGGTVSNSEQIH